MISKANKSAGKSPRIKTFTGIQIRLEAELQNSFANEFAMQFASNKVSGAP